MFDFTKLTLGEAAKVEELSNLPISSIGDEDAPKGLALAAVAFVVKRREDPAFTWNAAMALTFPEANAIIGIADESADESADEGEVLPDPLDHA